MAHLFVCLFAFFLIGKVRGQRSCLPGSFRDGLVCKVCPPGSFSGTVNQIKCELCRRGTFRATEGARSGRQCISCLPGTFADSLGSTECLPCPAGTDSLSGAQVCAFCEAGSALNSFSATGCSRCGPGLFSDKPGSKFCTRCPNGTFSRRKGATSCSKCPTGTFRRISESDFALDNFFSRDKCTPCQRGTFTDMEGSSSCKRCPPGTFSQRGASTCIPCPQNRFNNRIPARGCAGCPAGTSTAGTGAAACRNPARGCTFDTFENDKGICKACLPGERLDMLLKRCIPCGANEVSNGGVDTVCRPCPAGKVPVGDLSFLEKSMCECPIGSVEVEDKKCSKCPPGSFWRDDNSRFTFERAGVLREASPGRGVCSLCPDGTFSEKSGALQCEECPEGTYLPFPGARAATECVPCPPGSRSSRGFNDFPTSCLDVMSACTFGQVRDKKGRCEVRSCPMSNAVVTGGRCSFCSRDQRVRRNRCVGCGSNSIRPNGPQGRCVECRNGSTPSFDRTICECQDALDFGLNGVCVGECPPGFGSFFVRDTSLFGGEDQCLKCPTHMVSNEQSNFICVSCRRNTIAVNGTRCVPCPKGQRPEKDIFGRLLDICRPRSPYA